MSLTPPNSAPERDGDLLYGSHLSSAHLLYLIRRGDSCFAPVPPAGLPLSSRIRHPVFEIYRTSSNLTSQNESVESIQKTLAENCDPTANGSDPRVFRCRSDQQNMAPLEEKTEAPLPKSTRVEHLQCDVRRKRSWIYREFRIRKNILQGTRRCA